MLNRGQVAEFRSLRLILLVTLGLVLGVGSPASLAARETEASELHKQLQSALLVLEGSTRGGVWRFHELNVQVRKADAIPAIQRWHDLARKVSSADGGEARRTVTPEALLAWMRESSASTDYQVLSMEYRRSDEQTKETWQFGPLSNGWALEGPHGKAPAQRLRADSYDAWYLPINATEPTLARDSAAVFDEPRPVVVRSPFVYLQPLQPGLQVLERAPTWGSQGESARSILYYSSGARVVEVTTASETGGPTTISDYSTDGVLFSRSVCTYSLANGRLWLASALRQEIGPGETDSLCLLLTADFSTEDSSSLKIHLRPPCGVQDVSAKSTYFGLETYESWPPKLKSIFVPTTQSPWLRASAAPRPESSKTLARTIGLVLLSIGSILLVWTVFLRRLRRRSRGTAGDLAQGVSSGKVDLMVLWVLVLPALTACSEKEPASGGSRPSSSVQVHDYGVLRAADGTQKEVSLSDIRWRNDTKRAVHVASTAASCGCASVVVVQPVAESGQDIVLTVGLKVDGRRGPLSADIRLLDEHGEVVGVLRVTGRVAQPVVAMPRSIRLTARDVIQAKQFSVRVAADSGYTVEVVSFPSWLKLLERAATATSHKTQVLETTFAFQTVGSLKDAVPSLNYIKLQAMEDGKPDSTWIEVAIAVVEDDIIAVHPKIVQFARSALEAEFTLSAAVPSEMIAAVAGDDVSNWITDAGAHPGLTLRLVSKSESTLKLRATIDGAWPVVGSFTVSVGGRAASVGTVREQ